MNRKTSKLKSVIISVIAAILVWAGITYIRPPEIKTTISNLPVRFTGEEELRERGFTVVGRSDIEGLSVVVEGRKDNLLSLSGGIFVEVDVSSVEGEGEYELTGNVTLPTDALVIDEVRFNTVPVKVDRIDIKEIPVRAEQTGTSSGRLVKTTVEDGTVTITGARSEINAVAAGTAAVDITELTSDTELETGFVLTDQNGAPIEKNETISASATRVNVKCEVYDAVTLPVRAVLSDALAAEHAINPGSVSVTPSTVEVGLKDMSVKEVFAEVTSADGTGEFTIAEPEGVYVPDNVKTVRVRAAIEKKVTKSVSVEVGAENLGSGLHAKFDPLSITASGAESALTPENITAEADLSGLGAGTYSVPVTVSGKNITVNGEYSVNVTIS